MTSAAREQQATRILEGYGYLEKRYAALHPDFGFACSLPKLNERLSKDGNTFGEGA